MFKKTRYLLTLFIISILFGCAAKESSYLMKEDFSVPEKKVKPKKEETVYLSLELTDNTKIKGKSSQSKLPVFVLPKKMMIPLEQVSTIKFDENRENAIVDFKNGDKLTAVLDVDDLEVETLFGKIKININQIKKIIVINSDNIPEEGLAAYYPFNGNANDESGNGNNGTVYGAALTKDRFGNENSAYSFDGDDYINAGNNEEFNFDGGAGNFTIGAWIYRISYATSGASGGIVAKASENPFAGWAFAVYSNGKLSFSGVGYWEIVSPTNIPLNQWVHVAVTKNANIYALYIDGVEVSSISHPGNLETYSGILTIGTTYLKWKPGRFFTGNIDKLFIYNRALSKNGILEHYKSGI